MRVRNKGLKAVTIVSVLGFTLALGLTALAIKQGNTVFPYSKNGILPSANTAVEDFESYPVNQVINGRSGPLGVWASTISSGACKVYNDNGNLVLRQNDTSTGSGGNSRLTFTTPGSPNGVDIVGWRQKIRSYGNQWWGIGFYEASSPRIGLFFNKHIGKVEYYISGSYYDTGLTCTNDAWETYEVLFYSRTQFMIRKDGGTWHGPFNNRDNSAFSSSSHTVTSMLHGASTPDWYDVEYDDVGISWSLESDQPPASISMYVILVLVALIGIPLFIGIFATKAYNKKKGTKQATSTSLYRKPPSSYQAVTSSSSAASSSGSALSGFDVTRAARSSDPRTLPAPHGSPLPSTELADRASAVLKKRQISNPSIDDSAYDQQASAYAATFLAQWKAPGEDLVPVPDVAASSPDGTPGTNVLPSDTADTTISGIEQQLLSNLADKSRSSKPPTDASQATSSDEPTTRADRQE